jgi:hypothetical protein
MYIHAGIADMTYEDLPLGVIYPLTTSHVSQKHFFYKFRCVSEALCVYTVTYSFNNAFSMHIF